MLGKKNNSFQRMVLMSGIAQGSANGPKKIFGRENVNWQGPQKAGKGNENKGDSLSAINDFSHAQEDTHEYRENLHQAFIDDLGGEAVKDSIVANAVLPEMYSSGEVYTKESMDELQKKYNDYYDDFINTDEGAEALENELALALDHDYNIVSGYDSEKAEFITNQENIDALFHKDALNDTCTKFQDYVSIREDEKNSKDSSKDSSIEDILRYAQENSEQIEKEIEQARLQDAQDRGYDSIEDYEWDLEYAQDSYAEGRGFDVVQREAVSTVVEDYIENHGGNINEEEKEQVKQHYNRLFNDYYEEGFNSETVLAAALSSNSSFEVVDVRNGELEVNEEQEEQWAKSFEFDYVKDKFSSYAKDHPYQG